MTAPAAVASSIHLLDPKVIAQIAAGEVVERPASVVKELVENALDAGATQIKVSLHQAGLDSIVVEDNGHGLAPEELALSVQAHTTSKIATVHDLQEALTFGFRGEALNSMASVGELKIASRPAGATQGMEFDATRQETLPVGLPFGTRVTLHHLFGAVPARKKFLRSVTQELKACTQVMSKLALAHPEVGFRLLHNHKEVIDFPQGEILQQRFLSVTKTQPQDLIPVEYHFTHFHFSGYLGTPPTASSSRHHQYLMINHRPVEMPEITKRIKQAYGRLLEPRSYPNFVLNLELPAALVDSNVHPRKQEVRFVQPETIYQLLEQVVSDSLAQFHHQTQYQLAASTGQRLADGSAQPSLVAQSRQGLGPLSQLLKETTSVWKPKVTELKEVLQLNYTYLLVPTAQDLLLFDQHAVHERILFEQFSESFRHQNLSTMAVNLAIQLTTEEKMTWEQHQATLENIGFIVIQEKGAFTLTSIPTILDQEKAAVAFKEVLADLSEERPLKDIFSLAERTIAYLACRSAIQAGEYLAPEQRLELIKKLLQTPSYSTCPHGRPTLVKITQSDLEKMFKRTGGSSFK